MREKKQKKPPPPHPIQINMRSTPELRDALDAWVNEINNAQRVSIERADLMRGVLAWAVEHRPNWQAK